MNEAEALKPVTERRLVRGAIGVPAALDSCESTCLEWMDDYNTFYEAITQDDSYMASWLVSRRPTWWCRRDILAGGTLSVVSGHGLGSNHTPIIPTTSLLSH
ncbi:GPN-loop GTPase 1 [Babesia caballi]|uniref:GPN-loop GTPase 1 n=1 Tax=Babesia caballi TaxID=5871 RepID=A0AAV4LYP7_BABCB|nr:GPN-loop GTPase 1 [Babesia caballi]